MIILYFSSKSTIWNVHNFNRQNKLISLIGCFCAATIWLFITLMAYGPIKLVQPRRFLSLRWVGDIEFASFYDFFCLI